MVRNRSEDGFILIFSLLLLMGISAMEIGMMVNAKHAKINAQNHKNRIMAFATSEGMQVLLEQEISVGVCE